MWKAPITAAEALPYVVDAARREGYLGLMVILARTAEARLLHGELIQDWTSIHDVTGQRIAVLCPDPEFLPSERMRHSSSEYWTRLTIDDAAELPHTRLLAPGLGRLPAGRIAPLRPDSADAQQAAWTEAVGRCAAYFRIPERRLPAVLVLCLRDERDVLVELREHTSLYRLCKNIASHPGFEPGDEARWVEHDELTERAKSLAIGHGHFELVADDDPPRTMRRLLAVPEVRAQFEGLRKHLGRIAHVDPAQHLAWCRALDELTESDADQGAVLEFLEGIGQAVGAHPRRKELPGLATKARKVEHAVRKAADPPPRSRWFPESPEAESAREAQLALTRARLAELESELSSRPGLAAACETAAKAELGACEVAQLNLGGSSRIHAVTPIGPAPEGDPGGTTSNVSSGSVGGNVVQAGHIDAVHIHRARSFGEWWRRGRRD